MVEATGRTKPLEYGKTGDYDSRVAAERVDATVLNSTATASFDTAILSATLPARTIDSARASMCVSSQRPA